MANLAKVFLFSPLFLSSALAAFVHPGLLVNDADLTRAKTKIEAGLDPWLSSWYELTNSTFAQADYTNNAVDIVYRGNDGVHTDNSASLWHDAAAAFALGLRWKITGNETYADTAAAILTAWGNTLTGIGVDSSDMDNYLLAGFQGSELANAAELLRDYQPFADNGLQSVINMMNNVFLPMNLAFLNHELGAEHIWTHYFANWELGNMASAMAIAVLSENSTTWDFVVDYFKNGGGNGNINLAVSNIVEEPGTGVLLGQGQESGRDQGHSALDQQMLGIVGQQAWNQGEDLFAYNNSRILQGAEYFARYNLGNDVPFVNYTNSIVFYSEISSASRGATRPTWELLYSHYVQIKGLEAPWTTEYLNYTVNNYGGFEPGAGSLGEGSGRYDGLGWGSLLYHMDESDVAAYRSGSNSSSTAASTSTSVAAVTAVVSSTPASSSASFEASSSSLTTASDSTSSTAAAAVKSPVPSDSAPASASYDAGSGSILAAASESTSGAALTAVASSTSAASASASSTQAVSSTACSHRHKGHHA
ncbi:hypothetical protein VP1G_03695 [Cytospora mali]|uniref:Alginate lyase domain-containing protein n=1 Tax=Cytospora mali TaxID=578113 RepID=A0A194UXB5_CYTMA|nr:hypothetical protein VP1G_03695 [Valsa mali var. pyri (nom. inval.)]